jgi:hypothetical protein
VSVQYILEVRVEEFQLVHLAQELLVVAVERLLALRQVLDHCVLTPQLVLNGVE